MRQADQNFHYLQPSFGLPKTVCTIQKFECMTYNYHQIPFSTIENIHLEGFFNMRILRLTWSWSWLRHPDTRTSYSYDRTNIPTVRSPRHGVKKFEEHAKRETQNSRNKMRKKYSSEDYFIYAGPFRVEKHEAKEVENGSKLQILSLALSSDSSLFPKCISDSEKKFSFESRSSVPNV